MIVIHSDRGGVPSSVTLTGTTHDRFVWDVNGVDWQQPFGRVRATVTLPPALAAARSGSLRAVAGSAGSRRPASITASESGSGSTVTATARDLAPRENLTLAIPFRSGTFTPRDDGFLASPWPPIALIGAVVSLLAFVGAVLLRRRRRHEAPGLGDVGVDTGPPPGLAPGAAAVLLRRNTAVIAELLELAVRGHIEIIEDDTRSDRSRRRRGDTPPSGASALRFVHADGTDPVAAAMLRVFFGDDPDPGAERPLRPEGAVAGRLAAFPRHIRARLVHDGYLRPRDGRAFALIGLPAIAGGLAAVVGGCAALAAVFGGWVPGVCAAVGLVAGVTALVLVSLRTLTAAGAEARDRLLALHASLRRASLRDPVGADTVTDEALLPWAAVFGEEPAWAERLGRRYDAVRIAPAWFTGASTLDGGPFASGAFAASISGLSATTVSMVSTTAGGGVASGGGGGDGGGGGV